VHNANFIFRVFAKSINQPNILFIIMKKVIWFVLFITTTVYADAQKNMISAAQNELDKGELDKAWQSIQSALNNDKTKVLPKTWLVKGKILQAVGKSNDTKYTSISGNPIMEAYDSYRKALELDKNNEVNKEINLQLTDLSAVSANRANIEFNTKNYNNALELFELILIIESNPIFNNKIDTAVIFNCGLAALNAKKYDKAIDYFNKAAIYKYRRGNTYSLIKNAYLAKGDSMQALETMKKAFETYPNEITVIVDFINFYILSNKAEQAMNYLKVAIQREPKNVSFLFAEGTLLEKTNQPEKAFEAYSKATQIDSDYFNAYYNLGAMFYNKAVKLINAANNEKDAVKKQGLQKSGEEELKKSLPYMEKAHEIEPTEKFTAESLKILYSRLQMNEKLNELNQEMKSNKTHRKMASKDMDGKNHMKKIVVIYSEKEVKTAGRSIAIKYYDEKKLSQVIDMGVTNSTGTIVFMIPASNNGASSIFSLVINENDFRNAKAFRIPSFNIKGGQDSVLININKEKKYLIQNSWASLQWVSFPDNGVKINITQSNILILKFNETTLKGTIERLSFDEHGNIRNTVKIEDVFLEGSLFYIMN
jgi:tetratricopeptide (TPR) repeat protein